MKKGSVHIFTRFDLIDEMNVSVIMTKELRRDTLGCRGEKTNENGCGVKATNAPWGGTETRHIAYLRVNM